LCIRIFLTTKQTLTSGIRKQHTFNFIFKCLYFRFFFLKGRVKFLKGRVGKYLYQKQVLRSRRRAEKKLIAPAFHLINTFTRLPFILNFFHVNKKHFNIFLYFRTSTNVNFFFKWTHLKAFNLFSYYFFFNYLFFPSSSFLFFKILFLSIKINTIIINIQLTNNSKIIYSRSLNAFSKVIGFSLYNLFVFVQLPSGHKKVFSRDAEAMIFNDRQLVYKKFLTSSAGNARRKGFRSIVRGVAKNPVDHPHGGRTKSIKLPRTPWGFITKRK